MEIEHDQNVDSKNVDLAFRAYLPVLEARFTDIRKHKAIILKYDDVLNIIFIDKNVGRFIRGNPGSVPGLEVSVDPANFHVKGAKLIR